MKRHKFTLTGFASRLIFPQETASSGLAPASLLNFIQTIKQILWFRFMR